MLPIPKTEIDVLILNISKFKKLPLPNENK